MPGRAERRAWSAWPGGRRLDVPLLAPAGSSPHLTRAEEIAQPWDEGSEARTIRSAQVTAASAVLVPAIQVRRGVRVENRSLFVQGCAVPVHGVAAADHFARTRWPTTGDRLGRRRKRLAQVLLDRCRNYEEFLALF